MLHPPFNRDLIRFLYFAIRQAYAITELPDYGFGVSLRDICFTQCIIVPF